MKPAPHRLKPIPAQPGADPRQRSSDGGGRSSGLLVLALGAEEDMTDVLPPAFLLDHPGPRLPGRAMAHMLVVTARQFGDPISQLVAMKPYDRLRPAAHDPA